MCLEISDSRQCATRSTCAFTLWHSNRAENDNEAATDSGKLGRDGGEIILNAR